MLPSGERRSLAHDAGDGSRPILLLAVDDTLRVVVANDAMLRCLGRGEGEVIGRLLGELLVEELAVIALKAYAALQSGRQIVHYETLAPVPGTTPRRYEISFLPLGPGDSIALACSMREAAEEVAIENAMLEAADRERLRLGRDLHDTLGQELATTSMLLSALERRMIDAAPALIPAAKEVRAAVTQTFDSMRAIVRGLAPSGLEDGGLSGALERLAGRSALGGRLRIDFSGTERLPPLPPGADEHIYRFAQEAVANIVRHARASSVDVRLAIDGTALLLTVSDDGIGFDPETASAEGGMGLRTMRHRADNLGGHCSVESTPEGTRIELRLPLGAHVPDRC